MFATLLFLLLSFIMIWSLGYILILFLAPNLFEARLIEAAVALLLGLSATGLFTMVTARLAPDPFWFQRAIRWTIPLLVVFGTALLLIRHRASGQMWLQRLAGLSFDGRTIWSAVTPWLSVGVLLLGAICIVVYRPAPSPTIELYGSRSDNTVEVTVTSNAIQAQRFVLVVRSASGDVSTTVLLGPVSSATGPVRTLLDAPNPVRIELYAKLEDISNEEPMRWISLDPL